MSDTKTFKVRHGLVEYTTAAGNRDIAFRNMTVDLMPSEADRLLGHRAVVPIDVELEKQGQMMELPDNATDEQIIGWVAAAQPSRGPSSGNRPADARRSDPRGVR